MEGNDFGNLLQDGYLLIRTMLMDRIDGPPVENPELTQKYEATIRCLNDAVVRMGDRELRAAMNNALTDLKAMRMVALADEAMTLEAAKSELGRSRP